MSILEDRKRRRDELKSVLDEIESGKLFAGDAEATEDYARELRKSIELLDQTIKLMGTEQ